MWKRNQREISKYSEYPIFVIKEQKSLTYFVPLNTFDELAKSVCTKYYCNFELKLQNCIVKYTVANAYIVYKKEIFYLFVIYKHHKKNCERKSYATYQNNFKVYSAFKYDMYFSNKNLLVLFPKKSYFF